MCESSPEPPNKEKEIPEMPNQSSEEEPNNKTQEPSLETPQASEKEEPTKNVGSLFSSLDNSEETFSTYSVYILRQEETIQSLIEKYHVTKEELENYNDLSNLTIGSKIIIPSTTNDWYWKNIK